VWEIRLDAVELAGSGHPGMPMGCAELGAYLFGEFLRFDPAHPKWPHTGKEANQMQECGGYLQEN
jgi:transketolase